MLVVLLVGCLWVSGGILPGRRTIISSCRADLKGDGYEELLAIVGSAHSGRGDEIIIAGFEGARSTDVFRAKMPKLNPWKVRAPDLDGDGRREVAVGVWKKTRFDPVFDNRLFIYDWDGTDLFPKWLGSRLSRRFVDFEFADVVGDAAEELLAIERMPGNQRRLMFYQWTGFGFQGIWQSKTYASLSNLAPVVSDGRFDALWARVDNGKRTRRVIIYSRQRRVSK